MSAALPGAETRPSPSGVRRSCNGCDHAVYTARYGQAREPRPHVRCGPLSVDVFMIIGEHDTYVGCEIPPACPKHFPPQRATRAAGSTR